MRGVCPFVQKLLYIPGMKYRDLAFDNGTGHGSGGVFRGIMIHNQIARIVKRKYNPSMRAFKVHAMVHAVLREIQARGWLLIDAEVPVWWQDAGIATCIDFVCKDRDGNHILIELKTGYKGCYMQARGVMRPPFDGTGSGTPAALQLTPHNEHQTQLLCNALLWSQTFPDKATTHAFIFHVEDATSIHVYELSPTIAAHSDYVRVCMLAR